MREWLGSKELFPTQYSTHVKVCQVADRLFLPDLVVVAARALDSELQRGNLEHLTKNADFEHAIGLAFQPDAGSSHLRSSISWRLLQDRYAPGLQTLAGVSGQHSTLAWSLLEEQTQSVEFCQIPCTECEVAFELFEKRFILCEEEAPDPGESSRLDWFLCSCQLRGFCSTRCRWTGNSWNDTYYFCESCFYKSKTKLLCNLKTERVKRQPMIQRDLTFECGLKLRGADVLIRSRSR